MTISSTLSSPSGTETICAETICDRFTTAVTSRDFAALGATLSPGVRFHALVPPGPFELTGPSAVVAQFEHWFGGGRAFEILGHSTDLIGGRVHARWTIRRTPDSPDSVPLTAEQHAFLTVDETITAIDLLCSGWQEATA